MYPFSLIFSTIFGSPKPVLTQPAPAPTTKQHWTETLKDSPQWRENALRMELQEVQFAVRYLDRERAGIQPNILCMIEKNVKKLLESPRNALLTGTALPTDFIQTSTLKKPDGKSIRILSPLQILLLLNHNEDVYEFTRDIVIPRLLECAETKAIALRAKTFQKALNELAISSIPSVKLDIIGFMEVDKQPERIKHEGMQLLLELLACHQEKLDKELAAGPNMYLIKFLIDKQYISAADLDEDYPHRHYSERYNFDAKPALMELCNVGKTKNPELADAILSWLNLNTIQSTLSFKSTI